MNPVLAYFRYIEKYVRNTDLMMAVGLLMILGVMVVPLPAWILDLGLTFSLASGILILLVSLYVSKTLEFSVFPTLLLVTTLYRLALNVATTRAVLSHGHEGPESAGQVIQAFGNFVVGNNYVIGIIVFVILVIINFVVITKGSGRVAEVAARFTLDAMPGKQMAIDADLNAGLINENEARKRRKEIESEADFYGAMDGASKFVRGDAIAGIIITVINIVGGLLIGTLQKGLDLSTAAKVYTTLTVGDGLVAQIPALVISTAAGIVVTRQSGSGKHIGDEIMGQLLVNPRALYITGGVFALIALVPGLPKFPFFAIAAIMAGAGYLVDLIQREKVDEEKQKTADAEKAPKKENIETLLPLDMIELEVGFGLINVVEKEAGGDLIERITSIRKQFALDLGIIVPSVHIRDNLQLDSGEYRVLIKGNRVGGGVLRPDSLLAMDPGNVTDRVEGVATREPAFGLDALWIGAARKEEAELAGYTVVDLPTVMATHLTEIIRAHAHELIGRQEVASLLENLKKTHPKVVEDVTPDPISLGGVVRILQSLLRESVSIRDLRTILEALSDESTRTKDPDLLVEAIRKALARSITSKYQGEGQVRVLTLAPTIEEMVANSLLQTEQGVQLVMDPQTAHKLVNQVAKSVENHPEIAGQPILLTSPTSRRHLYKLLGRFIPQLAVLSHSEISSEAQIKSVGVVELNHAS